jgi:hypothetical protein
MRRTAAALSSFAAALLTIGCAKQMMHKPEQGIYGTFLTYGPLRDTIDCTPMKTQMEKDECRRFNGRIVEEPYQATIKVRNLQTGEVQSVQLDGTGSYRLKMDPGEYEVCVEGECSDPITVKMNAFVTYGQRLPRPADPAKAGASDPAKRKSDASEP